jgi:L-fuculose-phosphate aldolase
MAAAEAGTGAGADGAALRQAIIATALQMNALGINRGKSGNVSARVGGGFLITPSALPYDQTHPEDIVTVRDDGSATGRRVPSSEWRFHRAIYAARPEVQAIVHAHSPFATTLACLDRRIPAFHYMVAVAGGPDIRCASYATFGTPELADEVLRTLDGRKACLLSHHGMIATGGSLEAALALAVEVETLAEMYWRVLQIGEPTILSEQEMKVVLARFADYEAGRAGAA